MRTEHEMDVVGEEEDIGVEVLSSAKKAMQKSIKKKERNQLRKTYYRRGGLLMLVISIFVIVLTLQIALRFEISNVWKEYLVETVENYENFNKEDSISIQELNQKEKAKFYWFKDLERTQTFLYTTDNQSVLIEEHYIYEDIEFILTISNAQTIYSKFNVKDLILDHQMIISNEILISYGIFENNCYAKFSSTYNYYIEIYSSDSGILESILLKLVNN